MNDLVSIITPVYNSKKYLKDTIESVINQDYDNWELILVDDCSTDNSNLIIKTYIKIDERIRLISVGKNSGVANARNRGIEAANGRYIAFLDSDDLWHSNKLSRQLAIMKKNGYQFTFTSYELIDDEGINLNRVIRVPNVVDYERLLRGNPIGCLTVIIDKQKINKIHMPIIRHAEDYATWLNILKNGVTAYGINENLALYRKSSNSLSSNKFKTIRCIWNVYRKDQELSLISTINCLFFFSINKLKKQLMSKN